MRTTLIVLAALVAACDAGDGEAAGAEGVAGSDECLSWLDGRGTDTAARPGELRRLSASLACFDGTFASGKGEAAGTDALETWAAEASDERKLLVLRSHGGEAERALKIAERLQAGGVRVLATEVCASSCANYPYAGLPDRHVTDGTLVLFHGGFSNVGRAMVEAGLDDLYEEHGEVIGDVEADRARVLSSYDGARVRQDALLARAGVDAAIVHGVDGTDVATLPAGLCGGDAALPRDFLYFAPQQASALGVAPVSGFPLTDPEAVNAAIATRTGRTDRFVACQAPEGFSRAG